MREIGSGNELSDTDNLGIEKAKEGVRREGLEEQRREFQERIFQASDTLEASPNAFQETKVLRHVLSAAARLSDAEGFRPYQRTSRIIEELTDAIMLLKAAVPEKVDTE
jgi:hypothetical protein